MKRALSGPFPGRNKRVRFKWLKKAARTVSLAIAFGEVGFLGWHSGFLHPGVFYAAGCLCFPLELIWNPVAMGRRAGYWIGSGFLSPSYVDQPTPPVLIGLMGWFFLIGLPLIMYLTAWK